MVSHVPQSTKNCMKFSVMWVCFNHLGHLGGQPLRWAEGSCQSSAVYLNLSRAGRNLTMSKRIFFKVRQDTYLKIKGSWQAGNTILFVWTHLRWAEKEWPPGSPDWCRTTPFQPILGERFTTPSVYLLAVKSLNFCNLESLFSICQEVLFSREVWWSFPWRNHYS